MTIQMKTKKIRDKGVNSTGCAHDNCTVIDTHTEYNEVLKCTDCPAILTRPEWDRLHKAKKDINWNWDFVLEAWMLYGLAYLFLLLIYVILGQTI